LGIHGAFNQHSADTIQAFYSTSYLTADFYKGRNLFSLDICLLTDPKAKYTHGSAEDCTFMLTNKREGVHCSVAAQDENKLFRSWSDVGDRVSAEKTIIIIIIITRVRELSCPSSRISAMSHEIDLSEFNYITATNSRDGGLCAVWCS
jgi:hypothetical protein